MWTAEEYINHFSQKKKLYRKHFFRWTTFIFLNDLGPHCRSSDVQYMPQTLPSIFTQCFFAGGKVGAHLGTGGIKDSSPAHQAWD